MFQRKGAVDPILCVHSFSDQPPTSFYLVRLISKTPCMVLRLGFPIGTPAHVRNKVLKRCSFSLNRVSAGPFLKKFILSITTHFSKRVPDSCQMCKYFHQRFLRTN